VNVVEAEAVPLVEGNMYTAAKRGGDAPPGSWSASRTKGHAWEPGDPVGAVRMVTDGGAARGPTEVRRRAEAGSRTDPYYR
jgi:hypothetical protein